MNNAAGASPPRRRSVFRILWRIIVVVSVLFTGGWAIGAGLSALLTQCWDDKINLPSPDGKHVAHRWVHSCEGPTMFTESTQVVNISQAGSNEMAKVFESQEANGKIKMRWEDDHLRIDIESMETPDLSLHKGYGVHIAYHVPARLMSLFWENAQEQQEEEMHRTGKLSDADYETVKRLNRGSRLWREIFMQWASENAIIDDEGK